MSTNPGEPVPPIERPEPSPLVDIKESDEHKPKPQIRQ